MGGVLLLLSKISFYSVTLILIILIGVLSFKLDKKTEKKFDNDVKNEYIASYIDGEYQNEIPGKDDGYFVDKIVCDNGATATWDNDEWGINIRNATQKVKCSIYFKEDTFGNAVKAKLDNTGKCPTINGDSVVINSETLSDYLVCSAPDNYGTSYYFRGPMSGNYVKFANYYWRIVRINGDNSIRLIYDGTVLHSNEEISEDRIIGHSVYNEQGDDNAYVGYMYGTPGSSSYEQTHANINSSTIKKYVDSWYESNLKNTEYEKYLADNIFCNRRDIKSGTGYGKNSTSYQGYTAYKFTCTKNNAFSAKDVKYGNGALMYPIGMISTEEIRISIESSGVDNDKSQFHTGYSYWSISPVYYGVNNTIYAKVADITDGGGQYGGGGGGVNVYNGGVKPVINIKQGSIAKGTGSIDSPYEVE